ncbi:MAG: type II secretion system protein GspG [Phycisphaerales bacterium]
MRAFSAARWTVSSSTTATSSARDPDAARVGRCPSFIDEADYQAELQSAEDIVDPWGNEFMLEYPGRDGKDFSIISYGADGQPGGEGEAADIIVP